MVQDLKLGTIDGAINVPPAQFPELIAAPDIEAVQGTSWQFTELGMNCYDDPASKGNPVLLDPEFRRAINWAVDREKVVEVAMNGYATVGSTLIVPYSKYHWEPPAEVTFTYDPDKANELLDAAGYADTDGDGFRETTNGKQLSLRFYATSDAPENQTAGKLITGWLQDVGIKIRYQVIDAGALIDAQYNYEGDTYAPDWDLFIWYWTQDVDPQFMLGIYTPQQIEGWNDCLWTDDEYTRLNDEQAQTIDDDARVPIAQRMQEIFYEQAPYAILTYPYQLEAYSTDRWEGWVPVPGDPPGDQNGSVLYSYNNIDTYRFVEPKGEGEVAGTSSTTVIVAVVIVALAVAGGATLLLRRGRGRAETE
jgi:peptide/nickel transport system substrate-binding protein